MHYVAANSRKPVIIWLYSGLFLVFAMIAVGGITRLTESGLSITEWNVVMGSLPPLTNTDWQEEFDKYKQSPEFQHKNFGFTLKEFKAIYWWEFIHRLLGRLIGLVFLIPFLYFLGRRKLNNKAVKRLVVIFVLGGLQGFFGWYMVKSGLVDEPRVSHYRLALHLITALLTMALIWWFILDIQYHRRVLPVTASKKYSTTFIILFVILTIQIIYGAFIAGLDAGQIYNTWPKMGEHWVPPHAFSSDPWYLSLFDQDYIVSIQFIHRTIAIILVLNITTLYLMSFREKFTPGQQQGIMIMMLLVIAQFTLGVLTLLFKVPVTLGVLHQFGAVLLLLSSLHHAHRLYR